MHLWKLASLALTGIVGGLGLGPSTAQAAGLATFAVPESEAGPALPGVIWYPCADRPVEEIKFGPIGVMGSKGCAVTGTRLPLVLISHGAGGSSVSHHDTASALADAGFVVAAIDHPLDSGRSKIRRPGDIVSMLERPTDLKRLADFMLKTWADSARVNAQAVGAFGFSRGVTRSSRQQAVNLTLVSC